VNDPPGGGNAARAKDRYAAGSLVAGYRLEEPIGRGGTAVAFRARDEKLGRVVALKILAPSMAADDDFRQRFIREARTAAAVDDPHIIPIFEAGEADGVLFIAMRYVPGGDVRTIVRRNGPLDPRRAAAIIEQVASALDAAHAAGLVHRDVKPANMLVDVRAGKADHVYLADFGLSKMALSTTAGLTATGQVWGTVDYCSPEQVRGNLVDGRSDQYALACSAFELLTGAPPFHREDPMAVAYAQATETPPKLSARRVGLSPAADQVFARALAKEPGYRYPSCGEFANALSRALGPVSPSPGPSGQPGPSQHSGPPSQHSGPPGQQPGPAAQWPGGLQPQRPGVPHPQRPGVPVQQPGLPAQLISGPRPPQPPQPPRWAGGPPVQPPQAQNPPYRPTMPPAVPPYRYGYPPGNVGGFPPPGTAVKRSWTRNWTNWTLIGSAAMLLLAFVLAPTVPQQGSGGAIVGLFAIIGIVGLLVGGIGKLARWLGRSGNASGTRPPGRGW
jgi:serine/threonine protein kinase